MLNPFATMSQIAEGSDGCAAHEDMNFVQVPQSEDHDMDPSLMSNIVVKKDDILESSFMFRNSSYCS